MPFALGLDPFHDLGLVAESKQVFLLLEMRGSRWPDSRAWLGGNLLLRCLFYLSFGREHGDRSVSGLFRLGLLRESKDGLSFGEEVALVLARDADVPGEGETECKAGQLVIGCRLDGRKQDLFGIAPVVLVGDALGQIVGQSSAKV